MDALAEPHQSSATASLCSSWPKAALTLVVAAQQPYSGSAKRPGRLSANHHEGGPGKLSNLANLPRLWLVRGQLRGEIPPDLGNSDELYVVEDKNKADLARLFIDIYGVRYTGHPRLETLLEKNDISRLDFLTGAEEAKAFEDKRFVALHQSTLRKVDVIANVAGRAHDRTLKTNTRLQLDYRSSQMGNCRSGTDDNHSNHSLCVPVATICSPPQ